MSLRAASSTTAQQQPPQPQQPQLQPPQPQPQPQPQPEPQPQPQPQPDPSSPQRQQSLPIAAPAGPILLSPKAAANCPDVSLMPVFSSRDFVDHLDTVPPSCDPGLLHALWLTAAELRLCNPPGFRTEGKAALEAIYL